MKKLVCGLLFVTCMVSFLPLCANAETKEDIEGKMEQLKSDIQELNQQNEEKCQEFREFDSKNVENLNLGIECSGIKGSIVGKVQAYKALEQRLIEIEDNEADIEREADIAETQKQDEVEKENREEKRLYKLIGLVFGGFLLMGALFMGSLYLILKRTRK